MLARKFLFTFLMITCIVSTTQAQNWWKNKIKGEGDVEKREVDVPAFDGVTVAVSANVYIRQGDKHEMMVKAQPNLIDNILLKMDDGHLKITYDRPIWRSKGISIYLTTPNLERIGVSGSGNVSTDGTFKNLDDLKIVVSGSGNVSLAFEAKEISSRISGSGNINLSGTGDSFSAQVSGSGNVKAGDLKVEGATVKVSGSGNVSIYATETLEASVSGSGDVRYKGEPRVKAKSSGSGSIRSM